MSTGEPVDVARAAQLLLQARTSGRPVVALPDGCVPRDVADAYRIQDATLAGLGPVGGWKVGAKSATAVPTCSPIPAAFLLAEGCTVPASTCRLRGAEAEIAVRIGRDLPPRPQAYGEDDLAGAIAAVLPAIELADSRFDPREGQPALAALADCGGNSGLVLGADSKVPLPRTTAEQGGAMRFDGQVVAEGYGGNPAGDLLRLLTWLANHVAQRSGGLRKGDIVTTGTWTGVLFAPPGAAVHAEVFGIGGVHLRFE
jgi:2-keto-4-pentenoate hydratase